MSQELNIYQRINAVRRKISYLQKDATVTGYKAITHDLVTSAIRPHLIEHGIIVVPRQISFELRDTNKTTKQGIPYINYIGMYNFDFVNEDDPHDRVTVVVGAMAEDTGDKGPGGAISYAAKYALLKVFNIETGENEESRQDQKVEVIDEDELSRLRDMIDSTNANENKILAFAGVAQLDNISKKKFPEIMQTLKDMANKK